MFCRKCGSSMPNGTVLCPNCGENHAPAPKNASPNRGLLITACVVGGLAVVAIILVLVLKVFPAPAAPSGNADFAAAIAGAGKATSTPATIATAAPTQAPTRKATPKAIATSRTKTSAPDAKTVFANGFEMDVAQVLGDTWWASSGVSLANPDAVAVGSGYPRTYDLAEAEVQYIFHKDTETVNALQFDGNENLLSEKEVDYRLDPYGFYIYAFDTNVKIDGKTYKVYSKFFVCDDVLYEVQMIGDDEVSNYIAYESYGP